MNKKDKKVKAVAVRDLSLASLLSSHKAEFLKDKKASSMLYNGSRKSPRWQGSISGGGAFTLTHYGTPILRVDMNGQKPEFVKLPSERHGYSNGDLRGINTVLQVFKTAKKALKRAGITTFHAIS